MDVRFPPGRDVFVVGWGAALPPHECTTEELAAHLGFAPRKFEKYAALTGVRSRRMCWDISTGRQTVTGDELAGEAARAALAVAGVPAGDVDCVIAGAGTLDYLVPNLSSRLLKHLGVEQALALSLYGGCASFVEAFETACSFLYSGAASTAVVTASEVSTAFIPAMRWGADTMIFGDGAGAMVLTTRRPPEGTLAFEVAATYARTRSHLDGEPAEAIVLTAGGYRVPPKVLRDVRDMDRRLGDLLDMPAEYRLVHDVKQAGEYAASLMFESFGEVTTTTTPTPGVVVPHQGSRPVLDDLVSLLPDDWTVVDNLEQRGNLSTASIPVAFAEHLPRMSDAATIVCTTVGNGASYGAVRLVPRGSGDAKRR